MPAAKPATAPHVLLGVTGSIAAYKAPLVARELVKHGIEVRAAMTSSAGAFVTPLTLATLTRNPVVTEILPTGADSPHAGTWHIALARWADIMLVAPASANTIAKIAHGEADNPVAMLALSLRCPLILAPAMDEEMLLHPATLANLSTLRERGVQIIEPERGELASGIVGEGRMAPIETIAAFTAEILVKKKSLAGVRMLVTAGPTREPIDPVRYLGNRSSGRMGFAIAEEAAARGAGVTLVTGPTQLRCSSPIARVNVETAEEMLHAVKKHAGLCDILIMAAAVADFTPTTYSTEKIKKTGAPLALQLLPTRDILAELAVNKGKRIHVGFALETSDEVANARKKLKEKKLDMIVLNSAVQRGSGMGEATNIISVIDKRGRETKYPLMSKRQCATAIVDKIIGSRAKYNKAG